MPEVDLQGTPPMLTAFVLSLASEDYQEAAWSVQFHIVSFVG